MDEFHLLLKEEQTAAYSVEIWKRFRKWGGIPTGITQNVKDLLSSREVANIFENSDFVYMLNQAAGDREILAMQLSISPQQLSYVTHSEAGEGLIFYGNVILPFIDRFPHDTELYHIMTTKPEEMKGDKELAEKAAAFARRHWKGLLSLLGIGLIIMFLIGGLQSCSSLFGSGFSSVVGSSYLSEETELLATEANYSALEAELQYEVNNYESLHPGFDEYIYHLDGIYHDPHELAAYLTAKYVTYTAGDVQAELQRIFDLQYELSTVERTEIRYRTETHYDPDTGESYTVRVPYEYKIITVTLTNSGLFSVAQSQLTAEQFRQYQIYRETLGNMPLLFGGGSADSSPSADLSGVVFVNGTRPGNQAVVDIAKAEVGNVGGYPYWSWYGFDGRVEWCACYVSWCYAQAGYSEPRFAACTSQGMPWFQSRGQWGDRNCTNIAPGDAIFFDWDGDGSADHVGIVIGTDGTNVYTVEGNSGDACKIRSYPLGSSVIRGYGLMNW